MKALTPPPPPLPHLEYNDTRNFAVGKSGLKKVLNGTAIKKASLGKLYKKIALITLKNT